MTDTPTPEKIKAFLDDLARVSLQHGMYIGFRCQQHWLPIEQMEGGFGGYTAAHTTGTYDNLDQWNIYEFPAGADEGCMKSKPVFGADDQVASIDITQLSNHARLRIMGGQFDG